MQYYGKGMRDWYKTALFLSFFAEVSHCLGSLTQKFENGSPPCAMLVCLLALYLFSSIRSHDSLCSQPLLISRIIFNFIF